MKRIPTFDIFNKQQIGGNWDTIAQCLEYTALYMHAWNLFEWIITNIIAEDDSVSGGESVRKIWLKDTNPKCDMLKRLYEAHPPAPKRDAVLGFVTRIICKTDSCRDLRDTIGHSHIYWVTSDSHIDIRPKVYVKMRYGSRHTWGDLNSILHSIEYCCNRRKGACGMGFVISQARKW